MFRYIEPVYKNNMILKAQVLQEHTDYMYNLVKNAYTDYSDGIITGVDIDITDAYIKVNPGLIKHNQILYCLKETVSIPYEHNDELTFLRIRFLPPIEQDGGIVYETELVLTVDSTAFPYEMELGRFVASKGSRLYKDATDFSSLSVKYDRFDIRNVKYAAIGEATVSPVITTLFAEALLKKQTNDVYDVAFAMQCMNRQTVSRELIRNYIQVKTQKKTESLTNEQIYTEFEQILKHAVTASRMNTGNREIRRLIVD